jgi:hypothetical protein
MTEQAPPGLELFAVVLKASEADWVRAAAEQRATAPAELIRALVAQARANDASKGGRVKTALELAEQRRVAMASAPEPPPRGERLDEFIDGKFLIEALQDHVLGLFKMSATQIRAAEILLRKLLPNASAAKADPARTPFKVEITEPKP